MKITDPFCFYFWEAIFTGIQASLHVEKPPVVDDNTLFMLTSSLLVPIGVAEYDLVAVISFVRDIVVFQCKVLPLLSLLSACREDDIPHRRR
jgi:hypothetical protein